jgi:hypothetical protein
MLINNAASDHIDPRPRIPYLLVSLLPYLRITGKNTCLAGLMMATSSAMSGCMP